MIGYILTAVAVAVAVTPLGVVLTIYLRRRRAARLHRHLEQVRAQFHRDREQVEARFFQAACSSGKPRGLEWVDVDFEDTVCFARDRDSGQLCALVGVTVSFEAIAGGDMEGVEAVGNLRSATAVFLYGGEKWDTNGRTLFNLNPAEAIERFGNVLEPME